MPDVPSRHRARAVRRFARFAAVLPLWLALVSLGAAQPAQGADASWRFNWAGMDPSSPTPWKPVNWDVVVHSRDSATLAQLEPIAAQHGPDCGPPPAAHAVSSYQDAVFVCKEHMMTAINASGYGVIYLTPDHMLDFTAGTSSLNFSVSTERTSKRDWWDVWVTPWRENLVLPLDPMLPDLSGPPRDALHLQMMGENRFEAELYRDCRPGACAETDLPVATQDPWDSRLPPSARSRTGFELDVSQRHVRFGIPGAGLWWVDADVPGGLPFSQGVVQIGHHSYTPIKGDGCGPPAGEASCQPDTWHWSDFAISRAVGFTMLRGDRVAVHQGADTVRFPSPAPPGSFLRFAAQGSVQVGFDGNPAVRAQMQTQGGNQGNPPAVDSGHFVNYWMPVPPGTTAVRFSGQDFWGGPWWVQGVSIWNPAAGAAQAAAPTQAPATAPPATPPPPSPLARGAAAPRGAAAGQDRASGTVLLGAVLLLLVVAGGAGAAAARRRRRNRPLPPSGRG